MVKDNSVEFTYVRDEGDIVVYARNANEALANIRQFGFLVTNPEKIRQTGGTSEDYLKRAEIK